MDSHNIQQFLTLPKSTLLHQSKAFHAAQLDTDLCSNLLTAILYQLAQGEEYTKDEKIALFFACTKLFQTKNIFVRRLVYCLIRALQPTPEDTIIIISCLSKDINTTTTSQVTLEISRSNAIRLLFSLIDESMIQNIERLLTQTLIDTIPITIKSALIAAQHVNRYSTDSLRRWKAEISKSLHHTDQIIQYHSLSLTFKILQNDYIATQRFITTNLKSSPSHGKRLLPTILQLRVISKLMSKIQSSTTLSTSTSTTGQKMNNNQDPLYPVEYLEYLRDTLGDNNHIGIQVESAKIIIKHLIYTNRQEYYQFLQYVTNILIQILTRQSTTIIHKFSALKQLNQLAQIRTDLLLPHSNTIDQLLSTTTEGNSIFQNRTLVMYAINLSLKAGNDQNIELFLNSLENVLLTAPDDSKLSVLFNIRDYVLYKNQTKYIPIITFMSLLLKYENRFIIKNTIITCLQSIMTNIPQSIPFILDLLAEHIEDSEYPRVTIRIINLIGQFAYLNPTRPEKYLRYLFNRTILETSSIRAAAVSAIMRIGLTLSLLYVSNTTNNNTTTPTMNNNQQQQQQLQQQNKFAAIKIQTTIISLLTSVSIDHDDEVRDRARLYIDLLTKIKQLSLSSIAANKITQVLKLFTNTTFSTSKINAMNTESTPSTTTPTSTSPTNKNNNPNESQSKLPTFILDNSFSTFPTYDYNTSPSTFISNDTNNNISLPILPDLDVLESSVMNYLQTNFNCNTTSQSFSQSTIYQTQGNNNISMNNNTSNNNTSQQQQPQQLNQLSPLPTFSCYNTSITSSEPNNSGLFNPDIHITQPTYQPYYTTSLLSTDLSLTNSSTSTSPMNNNNDKLSLSMNDNSIPTYEQLQLRLPRHINQFLTQQSITNYWQCKANLTNTSTNSSTTSSTLTTQSTTGLTPTNKSSTTTEFPYNINQYIFTNGSILFETTITNNFQNTIINTMGLQCDELKRFHDQGHIAVQCMSLLPTRTIINNNGENEIIDLQLLNEKSILNFQYGDNITIYTLFTIKNLNLLINLCAMQYTLKLNYSLELDGEIEKGSYQLTKLTLSPTLFLRTPQQYILSLLPSQLQSQPLTTLVTNQQFIQLQQQYYTFDYRTTWESIPSLSNPSQPQLLNEIAQSFVIQLDPIQVNQYQTIFLTQVNKIITQLADVLSLVPIDPNFNISSLNNQTQVLVNLFGYYLTTEYKTNPTKILCRFGCMLQPSNNAIQVKIMIKTPNPHLTKLLSGLIKI